MTKFEIIYERFLSSTNLDFPGLTTEEVKDLLFNWTMTASSKFLFPRVSLELVTVEEDDKNNPDLEPGHYFEGDLTEKEITVIIEFMKEAQLISQLADEQKFQMYYNDANLKLPSQTGLITQLNRAVEAQQKNAKMTEHRYYRSVDNKPTIGKIWTP